MLVAAIAGLPLPLLPLQILWINLVTDGLPALALVMDPPDGDILSRPPRRPDEPMLGRPRVVAHRAQRIAPRCHDAAGVFVWALAHGSLMEARTLAFSTLVFGADLHGAGFPQSRASCSGRSARSPTCACWPSSSSRCCSRSAC